MPTMANITVKKADGTTNVTYTAIAPSAGDKSPAVWRCETAAAEMANRPLFSMSAKPAKNGQQRIVSGKLVYPELITDTTTGIVSVKLSEVFSFEATIDQSSKDTTVSESVAQFANLISTALVKEQISTGYTAR